MVWFLLTLSSILLWGFTDILLKKSLDYAAGRYERETMTDFQNLFQNVVAAIVNNANTEGYDFGQLKKDAGIKESLMQKMKDIFAKKK
jgi:hypothetical protein